MAKPIYLQLINPCAEQWDNMTPTRQGAHCKSCNKQVIDLTNKTENEVYELVTQHNGQMCARLTSLQLNTPIRKSELINGGFNWRAMAASLGALLALDNTAKALNPDDKTNVAIYDSTTANAINPDTIPTIPNTITGIVVDSTTKEPLYGVNVILQSTLKGVTTDLDGKFRIENASQYKDDTLIVHYLGYNDVKIEVNQFVSGSAIFLKENIIDMEIVVVCGGISATRSNPLEEEIGPALDLTHLLYRDRPRKNKKHRK